MKEKNLDNETPTAQDQSERRGLHQLRPIIMSGDNPKLILVGRKTQTRRIMKPQPQYVQCEPRHWPDDKTAVAHYEWPIGKPQHRSLEEIAKDCDYGVAGDRLWVRETFSDDYKPFIYRSGAPSEFYGGEKIKWKSPYHMRRIFSRITLEITKVRVERLQDISEGDAVAEGIQPRPHDSTYRFATEDYAQLWDSLHGKGAWDKNPWVWVLEFRKI